MAVSDFADLPSRMSGFGTTSHSETEPGTNPLKRRLGVPPQPTAPHTVRPRLVDRLTDTRLPMGVGGSADRPIDLTLDDDDGDGDKTDNEACSSRSAATSTSSSCSSCTSTSPCRTEDNNDDNDDNDNDATPPSPPILTPDELEAVLFPAKARREAKCREIIHSLQPRPVPGRLVHPLPARPLQARTRHRPRRPRRPRPSTPTDDDEDDDVDGNARAEWSSSSKPPVIVGGGIILDDAELPAFDLERTIPVVPAELSCDGPVPAGDPPAEQGSAVVPAQDTYWRAEGPGSDGNTDPRRTEVASTEASEPPSDELDAFLLALEVVVSSTNA
jgi:hypothetical protein